MPLSYNVFNFLFSRLLKPIFWSNWRLLPRML